MFTGRFSLCHDVYVSQKEKRAVSHVKCYKEGTVLHHMACVTAGLHCYVSWSEFDNEATALRHVSQESEGLTSRDSVLSVND